MQWLQDPNQSKTKLKRVRREASRHFRNKEREYLKAKIDELEADSKIKSQRLVKGHH
jgi:predicted Holliday junction resolvase-like endonuclease